MTGAPATGRTLVSTAGRTMAFVQVAFALAILGVLATATADAPALYRSLSFAHRIFASGTLPLRFGAETASQGAQSGALGWLGALATAFLYAIPLHYGALAGASALAALIACALVARRARAVAPPALSLAAAALAALCSIDALRVGATSTLAYVAAAVLVLEVPTLASALLFGALSVLWCNVEPTGILAPAFALANALGRSLEDARLPATRYAWLAAAASLVAMLATPALLDYPRLAFASLQLDGALGEIAPWTPGELAPHAYHLGVILLIFVALASGLRGRGARDATLAILAFVAALANGALVPVAGIVAAPILAGSVSRRWPKAFPFVRRDVRDGKETVALFTAIVVVSLIFGIVLGLRQPQLDVRGVAPYGALERLAHVPGVRRLFCSNVAWCDGALAYGLAVVGDGRIALVPAAVRDAQITISHAKNGWRERLTALGVDAVAVGVDSALATLLDATGWKRFARQGEVVIFVRAPARSAP